MTSTYAYFIKQQRSQLRGFLFSLVLILIPCLCLCLAGGYAHAQDSGQGTMSGIVTDPSGAVIVGAQVTVTNTATLPFAGSSVAVVTNALRLTRWKPAR